MAQWSNLKVVEQKFKEKRGEYKMCGKVKEKREGCSKKRKMLKSERRVVM